MERQLPWWSRESGSADMARGVMDHMTQLRRIDSRGSHTGRRVRLAAQRAMYLDRRGPGMSEGVDGRSARSNYNAIQGALDSVHSKTTTTRPRPQVTAVGGRWKEQRKATLLQRWLDGFYEQENSAEKDVFEILSDLVQDAMIYDIGWVKVVSSAGRILLERVWDGDIYIDPREERFPPVRTLYHVQAVDRAALIDRYPEKRAQIEDANSAPMEDASPFYDIDLPSAGAFIDMVSVVEAYRLGIGDKPGAFACCISTGVLEDGDYERPSFPYVSMVWGRDPERFRGQGFIERGSEVQMDLDEHSSVVREAYESFPPRWLSPSSANVRKSQLADDITVLEYDGPTAPTVLAPPPASAAFLNREDQLKQRLFHVTGASEMEATSMVQPQLSSGRAILAHADSTAGRFLPQGRNYENSSKRLAKLIIAVADDLAEDEGAALKVYGTESWAAELYDYRDVKMAPESYVLRVFPASKLPDTIAGRQEIIGQMMDRGFITDPLEGRRLMDMPDLERNADLASAKRNYADREIDRCLDGVTGIPTEYMDLPYALNRAQLTYCDALSRGGEEDDPEAMACLRTFIGATVLAMNPPAPPMPAPVAAPPGPPGPQPGPPMDPSQAPGNVVSLPTPA